MVADEADRPGRGEARGSGGRTARLKAALKSNIARRKAQAADIARREEARDRAPDAGEEDREEGS